MSSLTISELLNECVSSDLNDTLTRPQRGRWGRPLPNFAERLIAKIRVGAPPNSPDWTAGPCWIWTGCISEKGYGHVRGLDGRVTRAHRLVFLLTKGPIPPNCEPDHVCRVRACVNPNHLQLVTHQENTLRSLGPTAINAQKTCCHNGHPFDRVWKRKDGRTERGCSICEKKRLLKYRSPRNPQIQKGA